MDSGPEFFTRDTTEDVIIKTTLDRRLQTGAEEALKYIFANKVREGSKAQAAIVVMSADGAVRAMVGGRNTKVSGGFNRATQAMRQTGSAFKPFVYATALELGHSPNELIIDAPLTINIPGSGPWSPKNYTKGIQRRGDFDGCSERVAQHSCGEDCQNLWGAKTCAKLPATLALIVILPRVLHSRLVRQKAL